MFIILLKLLELFRKGFFDCEVRGNCYDSGAVRAEEQGCHLVFFLNCLSEIKWFGHFLVYFEC